MNVFHVPDDSDKKGGKQVENDPCKLGFTIEARLPFVRHSLGLRFYSSLLFVYEL